MNEVKLSCTETGEERIFKNSRTMDENLSEIKNKVYELGGCFNPYHNPIQILIPTDESFRELTCFIETLRPADSIEKNSIRFTINKGTRKISEFEKTVRLSQNWDIIVSHVKKSGGIVIGNTFDFPDLQKASEFIVRFTREFII